MRPDFPSVSAVMMIATGTLGTTPPNTDAGRRPSHRKTSIQREQKKDSTVSKGIGSGTSQSDDSMGENLLVATTTVEQNKCTAVPSI
jgi:hypothetical protein